MALFIIFLVTVSASAFTTNIERSPLFITTKGTIQDTVNQEYPSEINDCWMYLNDREAYSDFDISIINFDNKVTYITVELDSSYQKEINETRIDEIYQKINDACNPFYHSDEIPVVFMWNEPVYNFYKAKQMSGFIEARGTIPDFTQIEDQKDWENQMYASAPVLKIQNYASENGVALTSIGYTSDRYIEVALVKEVDEQTIDKMYELIETHYKQVGISDVPVVFIVEKVIEDEGIDTPSETNQTPGFTKILLILSFLLALKFRRV